MEEIALLESVNFVDRIRFTVAGRPPRCQLAARHYLTQPVHVRNAGRDDGRVDSNQLKFSLRGGISCHQCVIGSMADELPGVPHVTQERGTDAALVSRGFPGPTPVFRVPADCDMVGGTINARGGVDLMKLHSDPLFSLRSESWELTIIMMATGECSSARPPLPAAAASGTRELVANRPSIPFPMYSDPGGPELIPGEEARSRFYESYKRQANRFDRELKEYNKELNITLLFVRVVACALKGVHQLSNRDRNHSFSVCPVCCGCRNLLEIATERSSPSCMG